MGEVKKNVAIPQSAFPIIDSSSIVTIVRDPDNKEFSCIFCKRCTVDELKLGPLYRLPEEGVVTHYFCMLFSAGLVQQGDDRQGILGFLPIDILKEARRAQRLKCSYCQLSGASIGCNTSRCKVSFHFPCGLVNDANFQFCQNYQAFCRNHSKLPEITIPLNERECPICLSNVEAPERPIIGPCCKTAIFHKECLQGLALNAGYFFKCPTCNSIENFAESTKFQGIFVPEQDASWEREPDAYQDLYQMYNHCDAETCECPKGRDFGANKGFWLLARCRVCGSAGTHRHCGKLSTIANWACLSCLEVEARAPKEQKVLKSVKIEEVMPSTSTGQRSKVGSSNRKSKSVSAKNLSRAGTKNSKTIEFASDSKAYCEEKTESPVYRIKRTGVPVDAFDSEDEDDDVDLSKIHIQPGCRDYFPHSREAKKKFSEEEDCLPDWRNHFVNVQLVDIFIDAIETSDEPVPLKQTQPKKVIKPTSQKKDTIAKTKHKVSDNSKLIKKKQKAGKSRKRGSSWSKGWVKRRKKPQASKPKVNDKSVLPVNKVLVKHKVTKDTVVPEQTSSASQAVLVGIRRSQESLLQLQAHTSSKVDDGSHNNSGDSTNVSRGKFKSDSDGGGRNKKTNIETALCKENSIAGVESMKADQIENRESVPAKKPLEVPFESRSLVSGNGLQNGKGSSSCNAESTQSSYSSDRSQNSISIPNSLSFGSDKPVVKVEVDREQQNCDEDEPNLSMDQPANGRLEFEVQQTAHGIARHLLNLNNPAEANAQLRILEQQLPQLFRSSNN